MKELYKNILFYVLLFILIFLGISFICSSYIKDFIIKSETAYYDISSYTADELQSNNENAEYIPAEEDIAVPDAVTVLNSISNVERESVIAGIYIESVGLQLPILNGLTKSNLLVGAATMKEDQIIGKNNYCLAGHNMKDPKLLFGPLQNIQVGDLIHLTDKNNLYIYKTSSIHTVHESDVDVLDDTNKPEITLVTCSVGGFNTEYRLVIKGDLVTVIDMQQEGNDIEETDTDMKYDEKQLKRFLSYVEDIKKEKRFPSYSWIFIIAAFSLGLVFLSKWIIKKIDK